MKIPKKTRRKKSIVIVAILAVLAIGGGIAYTLLRPQTNNSHPTDTARPVNDVDYSPATEEEKAAVDQHKEDIAKGQDQSPDTPQTPTNPSSITITLIRATQDKGEPLYIRVGINGASSGICEVILSKNGQTTITKSFPIVFEATSSSCSGANIPANDFPVAGSWNMSVQAKKDATTVSNIIKQSVDIKK